MTFTLTREQLYDLVWSKPMQRLAKQIGISDQCGNVRSISLRARGGARALLTAAVLEGPRLCHFDRAER